MTSALLPRSSGEPVLQAPLSEASGGAVSPESTKAGVSALLQQARVAHTAGDLRAAAENYRSLLFAAPAHPAALLGLSLIARQTSQSEAALHLAQAAVAASPRSAVAWSNLGEILLARAQSTRPISKVSGRSASDLGEPLGEEVGAKGANPLLLSQTAERAFTRALTIDPSLHAAHLGLGNAAAQREDYAAALGHFTRADELAPNRAPILFALAFTNGNLGRHAIAIEHYRRALLLNPGFASAWLNLGVELVADGRDQLACPCYAQAIQTVRRQASDPLSTELSAQLNLGHLARSQHRFLTAQACYQRALRLSEAHPHRRLEVHLAFTSLEIDQQHFPQAWVSLHRAEKLPGGERDAETLNTRGILLLAEQAATPPAPHQPQTANLVEEAIEAFTAAEALGHRTAISNRANALLRLGRVEEALEAHKSALRLDPTHPGIRYNLALTQLRAGNFAEGWANYEIRWDFREIHPRPRRFAQPRWFGAPLEIAPDPGAGALRCKDSGLVSPEFSSEFPQHSGFQNPESSTLFLYAEQGLGDTLQFVRYLPLVAARLPGVPIVLEVQPPVERLLAASLAVGSGTALAGLPVRLVASGEPLPEFTHHCPLMSLPALFATTLATVPAAIPYLRAPVFLTGADTGKERLGWPAEETHAAPRAFSIGIHWAGNPRYRADRERSAALSIFEPLFALPGIRWVSLQKGPAARQIDLLPPHLRPEDSGSSDTDLADTASTIAGLDLVITTDSAVAHLTGGLGKPLWLLLPWQADWRWMQALETTPWYPTARLWRQSNPGNWVELMERVFQALAHLIARPLASESLPPPTPART